MLTTISAKKRFLVTVGKHHRLVPLAINYRPLTKCAGAAVGTEPRNAKCLGRQLQTRFRTVSFASLPLVLVPFRRRDATRGSSLTFLLSCSVLLIPLFSHSPCSSHRAFNREETRSHHTTQCEDARDDCHDSHTGSYVLLMFTSIEVIGDAPENNCDSKPSDYFLDAF